MIVTLHIKNQTYAFDANKPLDISIPLNFEGAQPNAFGVERATAEACEAGNLIGDTRRGGSCNFEEYKLIPHCHGTHTEGIGHLTNQRISIHDLLKDCFVPATVVTIEPTDAAETTESYSVKFGATDKLITKLSLEKALEESDKNFFQGLIIRTLPNDKKKLTMKYQENYSIYFSTEAMNLLINKKVKHLLVDLPSIDRLNDAGKISNHRLFWNITPGSHNLEKENLLGNTITEMIYVPRQIEDGSYILNLQIAPFKTDAAPSRPIIFELI